MACPALTRIFDKTCPYTTEFAKALYRSYQPMGSTAIIIRLGLDSLRSQIQTQDRRIWQSGGSKVYLYRKTSL
jgi:hypothetical protein